MFRSNLTACLCGQSASDSRASACTAGFYLTTGGAGTADTCTAHNTCASSYVATAGGGTTDAACATCGAVPYAATAAADNTAATYTCTSAADSRVSACTAGFYLTTGGAGAADTCTAHNICASSYVATAGGGTTDAACATCGAVPYAATAAADNTAATYTCTSAADSRVSACTAGFYLTTGGAGAADTCTACVAVLNAATAADTNGAARYTCTTAADSRISACAATFFLTAGAADATDVCNACTATCADGTYASAVCTAVADTACTACDAAGVGNVLASATYMCADVSSTRIVGGAASCTARFAFAAGVDTDTAGGVTGTSDHCGPITGQCSGNSDTAYDVVACTANTHAIHPVPALDGVADSQTVCCEDDVCSCTNGVGAGTIGSNVVCDQGNVAPNALCASCSAGFYLDGGACSPFLCDLIEPDVTGARMVMSGATPGTDDCDGTQTGATCAAFTADTGYEAGSITCTAAANGATASWVVVAATASANNCASNEPDTTAANIQAIVADSCDATATASLCTHTCATGYTAGSVTCQADGSYAVVGCTALTNNCQANEPDMTGSNMNPIAVNSCDATSTDVRTQSTPSQRDSQDTDDSLLDALTGNVRAPMPSGVLGGLYHLPG